jgi:hypothetical protein
MTRSRLNDRRIRCRCRYCNGRTCQSCPCQLAHIGERQQTQMMMSDVSQKFSLKSVVTVPPSTTRDDRELNLESTTAPSSQIKHSYRTYTAAAAPATIRDRNIAVAGVLPTTDDSYVAARLNTPSSQFPSHPSIHRDLASKDGCSGQPCIRCLHTFTVHVQGCCLSVNRR